MAHVKNRHIGESGRLISNVIEIIEIIEIRSCVLLTVVQLQSISHLGEAPIKVTQFQRFYLILLASD